MTKNKKAAMEMSVGTIVTIVLLMMVLVLGIFLIQKIFKSSTGVIDLTDQQLREEVNKLFSEDKKLVIYPGTRLVEIKQDETDGVGVGIKNILRGSTETTEFSYVVEVSDPDLNRKCNINEKQAENLIVTGRTETRIPIPSGDKSYQKVLFEIPVGSPLCTIRYRVNVDADGVAYATDFFDIKITS
ncbi:MAG: hypothetical protein ABIB79_04570 [archaeon]